ncbi:MAG TPA: cell envelope integrity protein TolA [Rhodocyclaceae bacterium]|jgi:colicin import membrane protein|nr:cell envelope integrity protein TolA [Rhodocyclaceae bacterium]
MNEAFHLFDRKQTPGKRIALVLAVVMHILLALFLIYGVRWQSSVPEAVEVSLVRSVPNVAPKAEPTPDPAPEVTPPPQPKPVPPAPKVAPPPKPIVSPPKPDIAIKEKEKPKEKPEPAKPMFDPMAMLKHEEQQTKQEQERKRLSEMLAKEDSGKTAAAATTASKKGLQDYLSSIRGKVRGNLVPTLGVVGNPEAVFEVTQLPSGELLDLRLVKSSGNRALDDNIERAIRRSSPLPKPDRPEDFQRILKLTFRPIE